MDKYYIGLDVGGTNVRAAIADSVAGIVGNIVKRPLKRYGNAQEEVKENIIGLINQVIDLNNIDRKKIVGIGISLAALFDRESGIITNWPNNNVWNGFPLQTTLQREFDVPVKLEDDANCAALGEYQYGSGQGYDHLVYMTISTGIGCGLILGGKLYTGMNGWAGEIGHTQILGNNISCKCGGKGCLQSITSGPALSLHAHKTASALGIENSTLMELKDVVSYAASGEEWALKVFSYAAYYIGNAISNLTMILDIPLVVIGGGVSQAGEILIKPIQDQLKLNLGHLNRVVEIKVASCGDDGGVKGAIKLIKDYCK